MKGLGIVSPESTLTDSLDLSRISAFILNVPLIEISVCVSWRTKLDIIKAQRNGILRLFYYSWRISNNVPPPLVCLCSFDRSTAHPSKFTASHSKLTFLSVGYILATLNFRTRETVGQILSGCHFYSTRVTKLLNSKLLIANWLMCACRRLSIIVTDDRLAR